MSVVVRYGWAGLMAASMASASFAQAPQDKAQAPATRPAEKDAARPPDAVVAIVDGEPVHKSEVLGLMQRSPVAPGEVKEAYDKVLEVLINTRLLTHFLQQQKIPVSQKELDDELAKEAAEFRKNNTDVASELSKNGVSIKDYENRVRQKVQWKKYLLSRGTDAELKKYMARNKDYFGGVEVRASHILVKVPDNPTAADKEKAKQKLLDIKKEIESGKTSFADAANKYSEDDGNKETPSGGDLGYFPRKNKFIEEFSKPAFELPKGSISDPVETPFGWHLIQVTDRTEGKDIDFKQFKDEILNYYGFDLQLEIVNEQKKSAKIEIKPAPPEIVGASRPTTGTPKADATKDQPRP